MWACPLKLNASSHVRSHPFPNSHLFDPFLQKILTIELIQDITAGF